MDLIVSIALLVVLDVLAFFFGVDSRDPIDRDGRARPSGLDVAGRGR